MSIWQVKKYYPHNNKIIEAKFSYWPHGKAFENQKETIDVHKQVHVLKSVEFSNKESL